MICSKFEIIGFGFARMWLSVRGSPTQRIIVSKQISSARLATWRTSWWSSWRPTWRHSTWRSILWRHSSRGWTAHTTSARRHASWRSSSHGWATTHWWTSASSWWSACHALIASILHCLHSECILELFVSNSVCSDTIKQIEQLLEKVSIIDTIGRNSNKQQTNS